MSIDAVVFPLTMSGLSGGDKFHTDITVGKSGHEVRNANWQDAQWEGNAAYAVKTRTDAVTLKDFHRARYGREKGFLLQVGDNYQIPQTGSTPQAIEAITSTTFQISKLHTDSGGFTYRRTITRPSSTASDLVVYANGVLRTNPTHYTYSSTTGIITFGSAPTQPVTITLAKFYIPVRFDVDVIDVDMFMWDGDDHSLHNVPDIPMIEIRE